MIVQLSLNHDLVDFRDKEDEQSFKSNRSPQIKVQKYSPDIVNMGLSNFKRARVFALAFLNESAGSL